MCVAMSWLVRALSSAVCCKAKSKDSELQNPKESIEGRNDMIINCSCCHAVSVRDFRYRDVQLRFGSSFWFTLVGSSFQIKTKATFYVSHYSSE